MRWYIETTGKDSPRVVFLPLQDHNGKPITAEAAREWVARNYPAERITRGPEVIDG